MIYRPTTTESIAPGETPSKARPSHAAGHATTIDSHALLKGQRELHIWHDGQVYRLQATRQGKLILTK